MSWFNQKFRLLPSIAMAAAMTLSGAILPADAAGTHYVFVSNERTNNILVYDPNNNMALVKDLATSRRPRDMQFNSDHTLLYVACGDDDVIDVIDVATLEVVDQIPTGRSPEMFVISKDDTTIYVSNEENSTVQIIDVAQKIIIHEISTGAEPEGVMLNDAGDILYVTSEVADMVHIVDTATGTITDNIIVGTRPRRFAMTNDGTELWVSDELSGTVTIIDRNTALVKEQLSFLPPGFRPVDVTPVGLVMNADTSLAFVTLGRANHLAVVNVATKEIEDYILVGSRAWGVAISPDQNTLYVTNGLSDDLSIIDIPGRRNVRSMAVGRIPHSIVIDD